MKTNTRHVRPRFNPSKKPRNPEPVSTNRGGRPAKVTGPLRNFNLAKPADDFLAGEKGRRWDMVNVIEVALLQLAALKPAARDKIYEDTLAKLKANSAN